MTWRAIGAMVGAALTSLGAAGGSEHDTLAKNGKLSFSVCVRGFFFVT